MKVINNSICAVIVASAAVATSAKASNPYCESLGEISRTIMQMRQAGDSKALLMYAVDGGLVDETTKNSARAIIEMAFLQPVDANPQNAIAAFGNEVETACYQKYGDE